MKHKGAIAAGHPETARAAASILDEGGNAFDAVLGAMCAACVAEPVLASLGGGGFLMARPEGGRPLLYDFFAQTPKRFRAAADTDFFPILADFGAVTQEFHIGLGSIATPGVVRGLFEVHRDLGHMPLAAIVEPAVRLARGGVATNRLQAYIFTVVQAIYLSNPDCRARYASPADPERLPVEGEVLRNPEFADLLEVLAREGDDLFYRGEVARRIATDGAAGGGHLTMADLEGYRALRRSPLVVEWAGARLALNPPPSAGGLLVAFGLELLRAAGLAEAGFGRPGHLEPLVRTLALTHEARVGSRLHEADPDDAAGAFLHPGFLETWRRQVAGRPAVRRGTTHLSVIDRHGNAAALTLSNGEGAAYVVPGTGIMLNNMLGEEDINPHGFHAWPADRRMSSMMAPTVVTGRDGALTVLGSGGSNRIRTAVLQVLLNLLAFAMGLEAAVSAPRLHLEDGPLNIEPGFADDVVTRLTDSHPETRLWEAPNLFFGGVHAVRCDAGGRFAGAGDPRRGGVSLIV